MMANSSSGLEHSADNGEVDSSTLSSPTIFTTKQSGDLSEMKFVVWCLERGLGVSLPVGDRLPYDLVIDRDGRLLKIQVKTGWKRNSATLSVSAKSVTTEKGKWISKSYADKVDYLVCYDPDSQKFYYLDAVLLAGCGGEVNLRLTPTRNNQIRNVRNASDYELLSVDQLQ